MEDLRNEIEKGALTDLISVEATSAASSLSFASKVFQLIGIMKKTELCGRIGWLVVSGCFG